MYCVKKMTDDLYWVGGSDRRLALFENVYPIPNGVSYNAYLLLDEKTVLLDTVDRSIADLFFENVAHVLNGRKLDYVIVNHMEPDHCAVLQDLVLRYPEVRIVCNAKPVTMIRHFFTFRFYNNMGTGHSFCVEPPVITSSKFESEFVILIIVFSNVHIISV